MPLIVVRYNANPITLMPKFLIYGGEKLVKQHAEVGFLRILFSVLPYSMRNISRCAHLRLLLRTKTLLLCGILQIMLHWMMILALQNPTKLV